MYPKGQTTMHQFKQKFLPNLPPGLSRFYIHLSLNTSEAHTVSPDGQTSVADYAVFMDEPMGDF
jgi:hypothetical protein